MRCYVKPDMFRKEITASLFDNLMREISNVVIRGIAIIERKRWDDLANTIKTPIVKIIITN